MPVLLEGGKLGSYKGGPRTLKGYTKGSPAINKQTNKQYCIFSHLMQEHAMEMELYGMIYEDHIVISQVQNARDSGTMNGTSTTNSYLNVEQEEEPAQKQNEGRGIVVGETL